MASSLFMQLINLKFSESFLRSGFVTHPEVRKEILKNQNLKKKCKVCQQFYLVVDELPNPLSMLRAISKNEAEWRRNLRFATAGKLLRLKYARNGVCSGGCFRHRFDRVERIVLERVEFAKRKDFYQTTEWRELRYDVLAEHGGVCMLCGANKATGAVIHVDHIKPRFHHPELCLDATNLQVLCADCNLGKGARDETDWRDSSDERHWGLSHKDDHGDGSPGYKFD